MTLTLTCDFKGRNLIFIDIYIFFQVRRESVDYAEGVLLPALHGSHPSIDRTDYSEVSDVLLFCTEYTYVTERR